jgi:quinol monooxygenase YgiN
VPDSSDHDQRFSVYGRMTAHPGQRNALIEAFSTALQTHVPGLELYLINEVPDDADTIWMTQLWTNRSSHDAGTKSDAFVAASARVMSLLAQPPEGAYGRVTFLYDGGGD